MEQDYKQNKTIDEKKCKGILYGKCPWCKQSDMPLCCHHYPIPKAKGGKKCIRICLNCHFKFHFPTLRKKKKKQPSKREVFSQNMPCVIDLRNTDFKSYDDFYEFFDGDWKRALKFLKKQKQ